MQRQFVEDFTRPPKQSIVLLCDWLPPDFGAVGQYTLQRGYELADAGHDVAVVGFSSEQRPTEDKPVGAGRLRIRFVHRGAYDKRSLLQRAFWSLSANLVLLRAAFSYLRAADEVVFTGSPPFLLHFIAPLNLLLRRNLVYRITDFHPECLMAEYQKVPMALRLLHQATLFWRRRISTFEVLGHDQAARLIAQGFASSRIRLVRDPSPVSITAETIPMSLPAALAGRKVLLYSGNFGVAHDAPTIIAALSEAETTHPGQMGVWLNAVGSKADEVESQLRARGVLVHRSKPVALSELPALLKAPHAHLISLRDGFVGYVLPSKVYACIASGLPVLYVGSAESDVHLLCATAHGAQRYQRVSVGDVEGAHQALITLLNLRETPSPPAGLAKISQTNLTT